MPVKISLTLQDTADHQINLSIQNKVFHSFTNQLNDFCENIYDFEDWAFEKLECTELLLDEKEIIDPSELSNLTIEQWVTLSDELSTMEHETTFQNLKSLILNRVKEYLAENADYQIF